MATMAPKKTTAAAKKFMLTFCCSFQRTSKTRINRLMLFYQKLSVFILYRGYLIRCTSNLYLKYTFFSKFLNTQSKYSQISVLSFISNSCAVNIFQSYNSIDVTFVNFFSIIIFGCNCETKIYVKVAYAYFMPEYLNIFEKRLKCFYKVLLVLFIQIIYNICTNNSTLSTSRTTIQYKIMMLFWWNTSIFSRLISLHL